MRETYDDNIYLDATDKQSDYITAVSPSLSLHLLSEKTHLELLYAPTFVWYDKEDQNDTVRHSGTVTFGHDLTQYLSFDLSDTYIKSEEPMEETEEVENVRNTRDMYQRNAFSASLGWLLGPEDLLAVGFRHSLLKNDDPTVDDGKIRNPYSNVAYWFDPKNGLEIDYEYTDALFWRGDYEEPGDDYTGHGAGMRFIHRFTQYTSGFLAYRFTNRHFDGETEDYTVHHGSIGLEQAFAQDLSISMGGGYFVQKNDQYDDQTGYSYNASVEKGFERGSFSIGGSGGWDEAYLEAERRGFSRYWSIQARLEYQIAAALAAYGGWSYRLDKGEGDEGEDRDWGTWQRSCGLTWTFLRWFSLSFDYTYANREDDVETEDYTGHRFMLNLTASKLWQW
ncbi:MAG: outer membrane beta-barrel protein [Thermodesulfobacteriota bacterium]|nr:outer membrane beta-barrel protein [Thermodesulfobacteriota bacterium]